MLAARTNPCVRQFSLSFSVLVTATTVQIKMPVPSFTALKGRKIFPKSRVSQRIGFFFFPLERPEGRLGAASSHVEHLLFLPVAVATELLAGLAPKGA